jgi:hypothetical protein
MVFGMGLAMQRDKAVSAVVPQWSKLTITGLVLHEQKKREMPFISIKGATGSLPNIIPARSTRSVLCSP